MLLEHGANVNATDNLVRVVFSDCWAIAAAVSVVDGLTIVLTQSLVAVML